MAYSPSFKKCVFIDYGLSIVIDDVVGYKTYSNFVGTLAYCSDKKKKTYFIQKARLIDLYHNDSVSLKITLGKIKTLSDLSKLSKQEDDNEC